MRLASRAGAAVVWGALDAACAAVGRHAPIIIKTFQVHLRQAGACTDHDALWDLVHTWDNGERDEFIHAVADSRIGRHTTATEILYIAVAAAARTAYRNALEFYLWGTDRHAEMSDSEMNCDAVIAGAVRTAVLQLCTLDDDGDGAGHPVADDVDTENTAHTDDELDEMEEQQATNEVRNVLDDDAVNAETEQDDAQDEGETSEEESEGDAESEEQDEKEKHAEDDVKVGDDAVDVLNAANAGAGAEEILAQDEERMADRILHTTLDGQEEFPAEYLAVWPHPHGRREDDESNSTAGDYVMVTTSSEETDTLLAARVTDGAEAVDGEDADANTEDDVAPLLLREVTQSQDTVVTAAPMGDTSAPKLPPVVHKVMRRVRDVFF